MNDPKKPYIDDTISDAKEFMKDFLPAAGSKTHIITAKAYFKTVIACGSAIQFFTAVPGESPSLSQEPGRCLEEHMIANTAGPVKVVKSTNIQASVAVSINYSVAVLLKDGEVFTVLSSGTVSKDRFRSV